jgi:hypothetical protein
MTEDPAEYDRNIAGFRRWRTATYVAYGVAGLSLAVGSYLLFRTDGESRASLSVVPRDGGASVCWQGEMW